MTVSLLELVVAAEPVLSAQVAVPERSALWLVSVAVRLATDSTGSTVMAAKVLGSHP